MMLNLVVWAITVHFHRHRYHTLKKSKRFKHVVRWKSCGLRWESTCKGNNDDILCDLACKSWHWIIVLVVCFGHSNCAEVKYLNCTLDFILWWIYMILYEQYRINPAGSCCLASVMPHNFLFMLGFSTCTHPIRVWLRCRLDPVHCNLDCSVTELLLTK